MTVQEVHEWFRKYLSVKPELAAKKVFLAIGSDETVKILAPTLEGSVYQNEGFFNSVTKAGTFFKQEVEHYERLRPAADALDRIIFKENRLRNPPSEASVEALARVLRRWVLPNDVREILSGYTGEHVEHYVRQFDRTIEELKAKGVIKLTPMKKEGDK